MNVQHRGIVLDLYVLLEGSVKLVDKPPTRLVECPVLVCVEPCRDSMEAVDAILEPELTTTVTLYTNTSR